MSKKLKQKKGFTIIEVVLVLAIAGLIFLMVFVVVPTAMSGQRDGERRQAMARVQEALVQYQTNNKSKRNNLPGQGTWDAGADEGVYPEACAQNSACNFIRNYLNAGNDDKTTSNFDDPDGVPYNMVITSNYSQGDLEYDSWTNADASKLEATDDGGYTIGGNDPFKEHVIYVIPGGQCSGESVVKSELRHFAVLYRLEGSGVYCGDSD